MAIFNQKYIKFRAFYRNARLSLLNVTPFNEMKALAPINDSSRAVARVIVNIKTDVHSVYVDNLPASAYIAIENKKTSTITIFRRMVREKKKVSFSQTTRLNRPFILQSDVFFHFSRIFHSTLALTRSKNKIKTKPGHEIFFNP